MSMTSTSSLSGFHLNYIYSTSVVASYKQYFLWMGLMSCIMNISVLGQVICTSNARLKATYSKSG